MIRAQRGPDRGRRVPRRAAPSPPRRPSRRCARRARSSSARRTPCSRSTRSWACWRASCARRTRRSSRSRRSSAARCSRARRPSACAGPAVRSTPTGSSTTTTGLIDALVADERAEHVPTLETDVDLYDAGRPPPRRTRGARLRRRASVTAPHADRRDPARQALRPCQAAADGRFPDRPGLAAAMVADVLDALAQVPALDEVIVVTAQPGAAYGVTPRRSSTTRSRRASPRPRCGDRGGPRGRARAARPGDCPALDPTEVGALLERTEPTS